MISREIDAQELEAHIENTIMKVKRVGELAVHKDDPNYFDFNAKAELDVQSSYLATEREEFRLEALRRFEASLIDRTDGASEEEVVGFNILRDTLVPTMVIVGNDILSKRTEIRKNPSLAPSLKPLIQSQEQYLSEFPLSVHRLYVQRMEAQIDHLQQARMEQNARIKTLQGDSDIV